MKRSAISLLLTGFLIASLAVQAQTTVVQQQRDEKVQRFLDESRSRWRDLNVPYEDGKVLHDLIVKNNYTRAIEIGTSTGHSTVWLAWALSKTGGKLITIEIDERRQKQAIENVKAAGLAEFVDFRLADAHQLVKELKGPFDFVFSDADKDWYPQYFKDLDPKLVKGACFTAHNVANPYGGIREFLELVQKHPNYKTTIDRTSSSGISISFKK
ncbi:MAG: class I SAM-dependent methyltransferase [Cyclobacteriaceae bacterium]|nr:class I SAM-dependent methyltransferase [Cyclobacteriaceae bacterium]